MDPLSPKIIDQLFGTEKELPVRSPRNHESEAVADHWTTPVLLERAAYLRKLARHGSGSATDSIKEYPRHSAMLSFCGRSSEAEINERFAKIFYVLDGTATLVSGGTLSGPAPTSAGEIYGTCIEGGVRHQLRAGDVAHIPAGQPHQILLTGGKTLTCLVMSIQENG